MSKFSAKCGSPPPPPPPPHCHPVEKTCYFTKRIHLMIQPLRIYHGIHSKLNVQYNQTIFH